MPTADEAVRVFDSFVGIAESPPHSNRTPIGAEFGWNGVAWCCEACSVVLARVFGRRILWTASVAEAIAEAKRGVNGLRWVSRGDTIRKGDLATFDWGGRGNPSEFHISMVRDPGTQAKFQTDGGNENDACRQQWRDRTYVQGFIRPPYTGAGAPPPPKPPEENLMDPHFVRLDGFRPVFEVGGGFLDPIPGEGQLGYVTRGKGFSVVEVKPRSDGVWNLPVRTHRDDGVVVDVSVDEFVKAHP